MKYLLEFFTFLYEKNASYSSINTAKSALLTIVSVNGSKQWNNESDILRFFKGIFNLKPPKPRYTTTWDVDILLRFLKSFMPLKDLPLKELTLKAVALTALVSGSRAQTIHEMKVSLCTKSDNKMCFMFDTTLKTSKTSKKASVLVVHKFHDESLCVFLTLKEYITRTQHIRNSDHFWLSWKKPHNQIGRQTVSRWLKQCLMLCGIDKDQFTEHSTRMASTSKAHAMGVGLSTILDTAGWNSENNFVKFYKREIGTKEESYADAVLDLAK